MAGFQPFNLGSVTAAGNQPSGPLNLGQLSQSVGSGGLQIDANPPNVGNGSGQGVLGASTAPAPPITTSPAPGGSSGSGGSNPLTIQGIQQEYGSAIAGGNQLYGQNEANLPVNLGALNQYTAAQENLARSQNQGQVNTYETQKSGIQNQQQLSLAELADQIRGQSQGLTAQLGAAGAGSSSAVGQGQQALAHEQNINRANIQQQAGANVANVNAQEQQTQQTLPAYIANLEAYKQQQTNQILQQYQQVRTNLEQAIGQATGEEKRQLGLFAQGLQGAAGDALVNLDAQINQARAAVAQQAQASFNGPQYQTPALAAAPAPIQAPNVSPFSTAAPAGNATAAPTGGSLSALLQQQRTPTS